MFYNPNNSHQSEEKLWEGKGIVENIFHLLWTKDPIFGTSKHYNIKNIKKSPKIFIFLPPFFLLSPTPIFCHFFCFVLIIKVIFFYKFQVYRFQKQLYTSTTLRYFGIL